MNLISKTRSHPHALIILIAFVGLGLMYSLATPPFEAGDESRHYAVVKYMADTGRLPVQDDAIVGEALHHWEHEGNQPPLYYALAAGLTAWIDTGGWADVYWYNPHTTIGVPLRQDNKNITIHPPTTDWQGHVLAVHLIRLLSLTMATVTVLTGYRIALFLFKGNRSLAATAMALTAFNPMFIFISTSVNNDNAVILFVTLALWRLITFIGLTQTELAEVGFDRLNLRFYEILRNSYFSQNNASPSLPCAIMVIGLLIGLGGLSKLYALGLLPLAGLWLAWLSYQKQTLHNPAGEWQTAWIGQTIRWTVLLGATVFAVAGWFYLRNAWLYGGDFLALQAMRDAAGTRPEPLTWSQFWAEFQGLRIAYWALFGGVNILVDAWIYRGLDFIMGLGLVGMSAYLLHIGYCRWQNCRPEKDNLILTIHQPTLFLLLGWCLMMVAGFLVWNLTQPATQGRLFYPAIAAISAWLTLGIAYILRHTLRSIGKSSQVIPNTQYTINVMVILLFIFACATPFLYLNPVYTKPTRLNQADLPTDLMPLNLIYDDTMKLLGYQLDTPVVRPGETVRLTLYWQLHRPTAMNYSIFVHLLGRQREKISQRDSYPGGGHWPTTLLNVGDIVADEYLIEIPPSAEPHAPTELRLSAGIYDYHELGRPGKTAVNMDGQAVESVIARLKLIPWQWPQVKPMGQPINFADQVMLIGHELDVEQETLTLTWQVNHPLSANYTVFIQAWSDTSAEILAGFDGPPLQGDYPTSLWQTGEIIVDEHPLDLRGLPDDSYLLVGLYNPLNGDRLPASITGTMLEGYAVRLDW